MAKFIYKAKAQNGQTVAGIIEASDQKFASEKLKQQKLSPLEIVAKPQSFMDKLQEYNPMKPGVSSHDLVIFSRQLSTMVSAGVPIVQSLTILQGQAENPVFSDCLL